MKHTLPPLFISAKDVHVITGRKMRTCYAILKKIRDKHEKGPGALVTVEEFCQFMKISEEKVQKYL